MASRTRFERCARVLFRTLLHLYPAQFRDEYAREMTLVLVDRLRAETNGVARLLALVGALASILMEAPKQHASVLADDLRFAGRLMRREKWFATVAIGTIALGIGLTSAIFSVAKSLLVDALPYQDADRVAAVWVSNPRQGFDRDYTSYPRLLDWRNQSQLAESFAAFTLRQAVVTGAGDPQQLRVAAVTPEFFDVVRTAPVQGRLFAPDEEQSAVVILGHGLWQRMFGADPAAIGRTVRVDSIPHTIVGVLPQTFQFPDRELDAWVPLQPGPNERRQRGDFWLRCVARLKPGVSLAQIQQEMNAIASRLAAQYPDDQELGVLVTSLRDDITGPVRPALLTLAAAVAGVLLIACANVAAMLTARGAARRREVAIRAALGAGRRRVVRQLLTEAVAIFAAGGVLGVVLGSLAVRLLIRVAPPTLSWLRDVSLDGPMIAVAMSMSLVTGTLFGVLPSWKAAGADAREALGAGIKGAGRGGVPQRFRQALVISQMAIATTVVSSACLFIHSLIHLQRVDLGFAPEHVLTARLDLPKARYRETATRLQFVDRLLAGIRGVPGVMDVGAASSVLLGPLPNSSSFSPEGRSEVVREPLTFDAVTPEFFRVLRIPLVRGRTFSNDDRADAPRVVIINETTARKYWPDTDPIGKRFKFGEPGSEAPWLTVIGVVADTRRAGIDHAVFTESYRPMAQSPTGSMTILVRTAGHPTSVAPALRAVVRDLDADQPLARVAPLEELVAERTAARRFNTWLLSAFGGTAVTLTAVGLYGLLAYLVILRRHEMAVHLAIGATPRRVLRLALKDFVIVVGGGIVLGLAATLAVTSWLKGLLFGIQPTDLPAQTTAVLLLVAVALVAAWIPARRAMRIDPALVLRTG